MPEPGVGEPVRYGRIEGRIASPGHDRVDDELRNIEHQRRKRRPHEPERDAGDRQPGTCRPGETKQGRQVPEGTGPGRDKASEPSEVQPAGAFEG